MAVMGRAGSHVDELPTPERPVQIYAQHKGAEVAVLARSSSNIVNCGLSQKAQLECCIAWHPRSSNSNIFCSKNC